MQLLTSIEAILSRPGVRMACQVCGVESIKEREVLRTGKVLYRSCAGSSYYAPVATRGELLVEELQQKPDRHAGPHRARP